jgi:hypothetical protein
MPFAGANRAMVMMLLAGRDSLMPLVRPGLSSEILAFADPPEAARSAWER